MIIFLPDKKSESDAKARVAAIHKLKERLKAASDEQKSLKISLQDVHERLKAERQEAGSKAFATKGNAELAWIVEVR